MPKSPFHVRRCAHAKYKYVAHAKIDGRYVRRYFKNESAAREFAKSQNRAADTRRRQSPARNGVTRATSRANQRHQVGVLVVGMHRSGTSAFAGALARLGVDFGSNLAPPAPDNEAGFWEHPSIVALHDELLKELGLSWDDSAALPPDWLERSATATIQSSIAAVIQTEFTNKPVFGIKDPRLSRFVPLWLRLFRELRIEPNFLLMLRHPWEVAESLRKRNGFSHTEATALWMRYTVEAEVATRHVKRSIISYDEVVADPAAVFGRVSRKFQLAKFSEPTISARVNDFVRPTLRHHWIANDAAQQTLSTIPAIAINYYEALRHSVSSPRAPKSVERFAAQFTSFSDVFARRSTTQQILQLREIAAERSRHIEILQQEVEKKTQQVRHFQTTADTRLRHIEILQQENNDKTTQVGHFQSVADERLRHIEILQHENETKTDQVRHFQAVADERLAHIEILQQENKNKTQQVLHFRREAEARAAELVHLRNEIERLRGRIEEQAQQLERASEELEEAKSQLLVAVDKVTECETMENSLSRRAAEVEAKAEVLTSHRDLLRDMLLAVQRDLHASITESDSVSHQLTATQRELADATRQLRRYRKEVEHFARDVSGKIVLPFGRSQRRLQRLVANARAAR